MTIDNEALDNYEKLKTKIGLYLEAQRNFLVAMSEDETTTKGKYFVQCFDEILSTNKLIGDLFDIELPSMEELKTKAVETVELNTLFSTPSVPGRREQ